MTRYTVTDGPRRFTTTDTRVAQAVSRDGATVTAVIDA